MKTQANYFYFLTLLYFSISLLGVFHHELWLDESHHWLLARDSSSLINLIENTRYEGHPVLWNVLLYGISRFSLNPVWMQVFHILIATATVFLFLRKAPFSALFKTLFIFGYFIVFEYNLLSRNYILGLFFIFWACSLFKELEKKFLLLSVCLAFAANVHLIFSVIALALYLTILLEHWQQHLLFRRRIYNWGYFIFGIGLLLAVIQMIPPSDTRFFDHVNEMALSEKFTKGFISLFKGIVAVPDFSTIHFWNSNFLVNISKPAAAFFGLLLYAVPVLLFFRNRKTLFFIYIGLIGTQIFFFLTQMSATRHDGITYILLIAALWIDNYYQEDNYRLKDFIIRFRLHLLKKPIIYGILVLQLIGGIGAYTMDYLYPFTASKETATYLREYHLMNSDIITVTCDGTAISPYAQKKIFFLCDGSYQSYCHWNFNCALNITQKEIQNGISGFMKTHDKAVYVSNYPILNTAEIGHWENISPKVKVRFLKKFEQTIVRNSYYYIYAISATPQ